MLRTILGEVPWYWALGGMLLGSVLSTVEPPGTFPVGVAGGTFPIGDITLPIALAIGLVRIGHGMGALGAGISALRDWRPRIVIEHLDHRQSEATPS